MANIIKQTGQQKKLAIGAVIVILALLAAGLPVYITNEIGYFWTAVGAVIGFIGMIYIFTGVKCPSCDAKWMWLAASGKAGMNHPRDLHKMTHCPVCNESFD